MKEKEYPDCFLMSDNGVAVAGIETASPCQSRRKRYTVNVSLCFGFMMNCFIVSLFFLGKIA